MKAIINGVTKQLTKINRKRVSFNYRGVVELAGFKVKDNPVVSYEAGELSGQLLPSGDGVRLDVDVTPIFNCVNTKKEGILSQKDDKKGETK